MQKKKKMRKKKTKCPLMSTKKPVDEFEPALF
jgi:hypothetical protein